MSQVSMRRPEANEYAPYYAGYVSHVEGDDALAALSRQVQDIKNLPSEFPEERANEGYAPGKWSAKEVIGHMSDAERVFAYRALRFARDDRTPLPGFEQDGYVAAGNFNRRTVADLAAEFAAVRETTLALFANLGEEAWARGGPASGHEVSVRALAFIIAGHAEHHIKILRARYR